MIDYDLAWAIALGVFTGLFAFSIVMGLVILMQERGKR